MVGGRFLPWALPLTVLWVLGCGARTTLDYDVSGSGGSSGAGTGHAGGVATVGGNSGSGAAAYAGSDPGTGGGAFSMGGSGLVITGGSGPATGGSGPAAGGSIGIDPDPGGGGGDGRPKLRRACEDFCTAYVNVCSLEYSDSNECAVDCLKSANDFKDYCRKVAINTFACLAVVFEGQMDCDSALLDAYDVCGDWLTQFEYCGDG